MPELLFSGPASLDEIIDAIRVQSRDSESGAPIFSDDEIKLAVRQAILNSHGTYFTTHQTTLTFTAGTFEYTIADDIQRIVLITKQPSSAGLDPTRSDTDLTSWRHFNFGYGANKLIFFRDYPDSTLNIYYERDVPVPIDNRTLDTALGTGDTSISLTTSTENQLWRVALPAYFKIDQEIVKLTAISGNDDGTIERAQFGTTAATHSVGDTVSQVIFAASDRFYNFLEYEVGKILNRNRIQSGTGNIDVAPNVTANALFTQDSQQVRTEHPMTKRSRKMHFSKSRRPRRRFL